MGRNGTRAFQKSRECGFLGALVSLISYDHVGVKRSKILMRASLHRISGLLFLVSSYHGREIGMSRYTKKDIIRMAEEEDVEFIRLQFTDIFGMLKNVAITVSQLEKA